ncbi:hypothetical protein VNI00_004408 [Paramarasmius palmivorus]|uniref:Uncharacterized protein n=1 Tax=Paramarasmius palmivorus TaxID=297713 RepID=A0AAW0DMN2_9AGAR
MFSFFRKNSAADSASTSQAANEQLRTPSPSVGSAVGKTRINESPLHNDDNLGPPDTPSPPAHPLDADLGLITSPAALYELVSSVPAKTLHEYTLNHLIPPPPDSRRAAQLQLPIHTPSSITLTHLTSFFSALRPPPRLHCVRCHNFYFDVENSDRSCLVAHDDESAEVERVGVGKGKSDAGTQYETLWGCCGKTVEGDGDMGPPDGWCYEGKHTTDPKRARFRADSSIHNDKLTSCSRLKCYEPKPEPEDVSSSDESEKRSRQRKRTTRKRARRADDDGDEEREANVDATSATLVNEDSISVGSSKDKPKKTPAKPRKKRAKTTNDDKAFKPEGTPSEDEDDDMDVDETASVTSKRKSRAKPKTKAARSSSKAPASRRKPAANSASASDQGTPAGPSSPRMAPPSSPGSPTKSVRPRKQSVVFSRDAKSGDESASEKRSSKPRSSVGGRKSKKLEEIVQSSIDGET